MASSVKKNKKNNSKIFVYISDYNSGKSITVTKYYTVANTVANKTSNY